MPDGISLWMVLLTTFLFPVSVLASWTVTTDVRRYMIAMLVLETAAKTEPQLPLEQRTSRRYGAARITLFHR